MPWLIQVYTPGINYAEEDITVSKKCLGSTYVRSIQEAYDYISRTLRETGYCHALKYLHYYKLKLYFRGEYHKKDLDFILFEHYYSGELKSIFEKNRDTN